VKTFFKYLLFALLIGFAVQLQAQQYLILQKSGKAKNFKYQPGNTISLKTVDGDFFIRGEITAIKDSAFWIDDRMKIELDKIALVFRKSGFLNRLSWLFFVRGGVAYFLIDGANRTIAGDQPVIDESTWLISGAMIATGVALRPLVTRKYDLSKKWRLKILDFEAMK
jgi:hypothetical protein